MDSKLVADFQVFGLSEYESKAYSSLVSTGQASSVSEISQICDVPRSNLYSVLEKLNKKGFVEIQGGRPQLFKALDPKEILGEIEEKRKKEMAQARKRTIERLNTLQGNRKTETIPILAWGIKGYDSVINKMKGVINRSKKEMIIISPTMDVFNDELYKELKEASERGVKIKVSTEKNEEIGKLSKIAIVRTREKIRGIDIVSDEKEVLLAPSLPAVAGWLDNEEMALYLKNFLDLIWKDSKVLKK